MRTGDCDGGQAESCGIWWNLVRPNVNASKDVIWPQPGSTVVFWMATEDGKMMEGRGAGESCPTFPKMVPDDPMSEGKSRASLVRRMPLPTAPACPSRARKSIMGTPQDRS